MVGIQYDLIGDEAIFQGADWYKRFQFIDPDTGLPYDLTGYSAKSQARKLSTDTDPAIDFVAVVEDEKQAIVKISLTNLTTSATPKGTYTYDLELIEPSPSAIIHKAVRPSAVEVVDEYTK